VGVLVEIEEAIKMKPEEYLTYFEDFIFVADKESGQRNPFAEVSNCHPPYTATL
jgi:hypothetical protein